MKKNLKLYWLVWTIGLLGGLLFQSSRFIKFPLKIKIAGFKKEKLYSSKGLLVIANHPSFLEPMILPFLFFPYYLFDLKFLPLSAPKLKYYNKWWFQPLRPTCIPVAKGRPREILLILKKIKQQLEAGKTVILHPEGTRTFKCARAGLIKISKSGKKIGNFKKGIERIILNTDCKILPIWIEGGEKILSGKRLSFREEIKIVIGDSIDSLRLQCFAEKGIAGYLEEIILQLAEKS